MVRNDICDIGEDMKVEVEVPSVTIRVNVQINDDYKAYTEGWETYGQTREEAVGKLVILLMDKHRAGVHIEDVK